MENHVFICYASEDRDFVLTLATNLKNRGILVWLDHWDIPHGANWNKTRDNALYEAMSCLVVLSPAAVDSEQVEAEWTTALEEKKSVVPLLYRSCRIPSRLRLIQRIDFTSREPDDVTALEEVERAFRGRNNIASTEATVSLKERSRADVSPNPQSSLPPLKEKHGWLSWFTMPRVHIAFSFSIAFAALFFAVAYLLPPLEKGTLDLPSTVSSVPLPSSEAKPPDSKATTLILEPSPPKAEVKPEVEVKTATNKGMISIPAGKFWMGCDEAMEKQCGNEEKPEQAVYLNDFSIDKYEVTVAEYRRCVESAQCSVDGLSAYGTCNWENPDRLQHPINCVNVYQAQAYCQWVGKRLPTEAEWEKAARGKEKYRYPWGNFWDAKRANSAESKIDGTSPIGSYPLGISPYGVHDMAGNISEWILDDGNYLREKLGKNLLQARERTIQMMKGGSWYNKPQSLRISYRHLSGLALYNRRSSFPFAGFRCVQ